VLDDRMPWRGHYSRIQVGKEREKSKKCFAKSAPGGGRETPVDSIRTEGLLAVSEHDRDG